jgi:hypothetical protein
MYRTGYAQAALQEANQARELWATGRARNLTTVASVVGEGLISGTAAALPLAAGAVAGKDWKERTIDALVSAGIATMFQTAAELDQIYMNHGTRGADGVCRQIDVMRLAVANLAVGENVDQSVAKLQAIVRGRAAS